MLIWHQHNQFYYLLQQLFVLKDWLLLCLQSLLLQFKVSLCVLLSFITLTLTVSFLLALTMFLGSLFLTLLQCILQPCTTDHVVMEIQPVRLYLKSSSWNSLSKASFGSSLITGLFLMFFALLAYLCVGGVMQELISVSKILHTWLWSGFHHSCNWPDPTIIHCTYIRHLCPPHHSPHWLPYKFWHCLPVNL